MLEIDPEANLHVVGQAKNGCEMVELFAQLQPDIGLVDNNQLMRLTDKLMSRKRSINNDFINFCDR